MLDDDTFDVEDDNPIKELIYIGENNIPCWEITDP